LALARARVAQPDRNVYQDERSTAEVLDELSELAKHLQFVPFTIAESDAEPARLAAVHPYELGVTRT